MDAPEPLDGLGSGPKKQVIGIDEDDLGAQILERGVGQPLDRALARDRHERGGLDGPVDGLEEACPGRGIRVGGDDLERFRHGANLK